jgi:hypothetical protein
MYPSGPIFSFDFLNKISFIKDPAASSASLISVPSGSLVDKSFTFLYILAINE